MLARHCLILSFNFTLLISFFLGVNTLRAEERQSFASKAATHLMGYAFDKIVLDSIFDPVSDKPDLTEVKRQLDYIAAQDRQHSAQIYQLQREIDAKMNREEVRALIMQALNRIDSRMASQARQIQDHQMLLEIQQRAISEVRADVNYLAMVQERFENDVQKQFSAQSVRTAKIEDDVERIKRDYPRWTPQQQAATLGASGMDLLWKGNHKEAIRAFRAAHGFEPSDPGHLYGLAMAYRRDNENEFAKLVIARGIALERKRPLAQWYRRTIERIQGAPRQWLEEQRFDPVYGVYVPGIVQVPKTLIEDKPF